MTEKEIKNYLVENKMLVFYSIRGSFLYGTNIETSDVDRHGIFIYPNKMRLGLMDLNEDLHDDKGDNVLFEMKKYMKMAIKSNPTVLEMIFTPDEFIEVKTPVSELLILNRNLFLTKECYFSFGGYAFSQIKKACGKNKKIHGKDRYLNNDGLDKIRKLLDNNIISTEWIEKRFSTNFLKAIVKGRECRKTSVTSFKEMDEFLLDEDIKILLPPRQLDFCYFAKSMAKDFPMRPAPLKETGIDLKQYNCSSMEHIGGVYRIYYYGDKANGVFKGGDIVCSSIPIEDEASRFSGLLIYAHNEYESAKKDWRSYWEWMSERNENRWGISDSESVFEYDRKNMQHTFRLLLSGENIAKEGEPIVRFSGEKLKFLRDVREGKFSYDYLIKYANDKILALKEEFDKSSLPDRCDINKVSELYDEIIDLR